MESKDHNPDAWERPPGDGDALEPVLRDLAMRMQETGDRAPEFWERQRTAILSRLPAPGTNRPSNPIAAWAMAAAILLIAGSMFRTGPRVAPAPEQAQGESDRELLLKVESAMQNGGPAALEPAALLAEEVSEHSGRVGSHQSQEDKDEE
jgi:hypothetical protein